MAVKLPDFEQWTEAMTSVLQLNISPELRKGVAANMKTAAKMAALLEKVPLKDETEPAPVFRA